MANSEKEARASRTEFLARIQRFTDMTLDRLGEASVRKDVDEKETRMLGSVVLRALNIWERTFHSDRNAPLLKKESGNNSTRSFRSDERGD